MMAGLKFSGMATAILALAPLAASAQTSAPSSAQERPVISRESLGQALDQLRGIVSEEPPTTTPENVIDFESVEGPASGAGILLTTQYSESHGLSFGKGASVHFCARVTDDVMASLCPYPQAASGQRAAAYDPRTGGAPALALNFSKPVDAVTMRINPTGGSIDEAFAFVMTGFDANGNRAAREVVDFNWFQDAFSWPNSATLKTGGAPLARITLEMQRKAAGNRAVRFLIDDLGLNYSAAAEGPTPLAAVIFDRSPQKELGKPEIIRPETTRPEKDQLFKAAPKVRLPIDWDLAEQVVTAQTQRGMTVAPVINRREVDRAALPVILPPSIVQGADIKVDIVTQSSGDSYSAAYKIGDELYEIYGTRAFTVVGKRRSGAPPGVVITKTPTVWTAKFSAFGGASYRVVRICDTGTAAGDQDCIERDDMSERVAELMVVLGETAAGRP